MDQLTPEHLCHEVVEKNIRTRIYQVQLLHKNFPQPLNVVVIVKTNLTTGKSAKVLLFSDDLELAYDKLIDYYQLRFQIEFNFRDAKQYWGLEDFMNVNEIQVSNGVVKIYFIKMTPLLIHVLIVFYLHIKSLKKNTRTLFFWHKKCLKHR